MLTSTYKGDRPETSSVMFYGEMVAYKAWVFLTLLSIGGCAGGVWASSVLVIAYCDSHRLVLFGSMAMIGKHRGHFNNVGAYHRAHECEAAVISSLDMV